jgi:hypothetical protein
MGYTRITILLVDGTKLAGVRHFPEPIVVADIRSQAWHLAGEVLGRERIQDVVVTELAADDPAVVALILGQQRKNREVPRSDGEHPYLKQQRRKPSR